MDRLYYEPKDVQALTCGAYVTQAPAGSGYEAMNKYRVWYRGLSWLVDADKFEKNHDSVAWWDHCWKARTQGFRFSPCDGVPAEIHAIEDRVARDSARLAWRQETIEVATALIDVRYGFLLTNWFPCWVGVERLAWLNLPAQTSYKVSISVREDDPSRAEWMDLWRVADL